MGDYIGGGGTFGGGGIALGVYSGVCIGGGGDSTGRGLLLGAGIAAIC